MKTIYLILVFLITCSVHCDFVDIKTTSANCVLVGEISMQENDSRNAKFLGKVKNVGEAKALWVKITFTIKDSEGSTLDYDFAFSDPTDLNPGQTGSFECDSDAPYSQVSPYDYETTWSEED